jgi:pimeloyl-ACP methyl ester carboxylesterase
VIVFVHGIYGNSYDTWSCPSKAFWPELLKDDPAFNGLDIYVAGFDSPKFGNQMTIDEVISGLKNRFDSDGVFSKPREVVFVAHSLGGLIVQRFLLTYRKLADQVPFIYFFSTPETGAQIAQLARVISSDPLLKQLAAGDSNDYLLNLESEWRSAGFATHRYCAYEKQPMFGVLVVDRLTGTRGCEKAIAVNANHSTIVKPCDRPADSYIALRNMRRAKDGDALPSTRILLLRQLRVACLTVFE